MSCTNQQQQIQRHWNNCGKIQIGNALDAAIQILPFVDVAEIAVSIVSAYLAEFAWTVGNEVKTNADGVPDAGAGGRYPAGDPADYLQLVTREEAIGYPDRRRVADSGFGSGGEVMTMYERDLLMLLAKTVRETVVGVDGNTREQIQKLEELVNGQDNDA